MSLNFCSSFLFTQKPLTGLEINRQTGNQLSAFVIQVHCVRQMSRDYRPIKLYPLGSLLYELVFTQQHYIAQKWLSA